MKFGIVTLLLLSLGASAHGSESDLIGDWLLGDPEGTRVLIRFQGEQWGIRHHFDDGGKLQHSITFNWFADPPGEAFSLEPSGGINQTRRSIHRAYCENSTCLEVEGFDGEFVRIAPD